MSTTTFSNILNPVTTCDHNFFYLQIERRIRAGCGGVLQVDARTKALGLLFGVVYRDANNPTWRHIEGASLVKTMSKRFMDKAPLLLFGILGIVLTWSKEMSADEKAHYCRGVADLIPMLLR